MKAWRSWRSLFSRATWQRWRRGRCPVEALATVRHQLSEFSQLTDEGFTELARAVGEIRAQFQALQARTAILEAILQDRDEDRALTRAYAVYKHSVDLVHAGMGVALADHEHLEKVETRLLAACAGKGELRQHSMIFRMVTVETRMEAVRLEHEGQQVFVTVADAIQHMGTQIQTTAEAAFGRIEGVVWETRRERDLLQRHQLVLHESAQGSVQRIREELDGLRLALAPSAEEIATVRRISAELEELLTPVIMALQAQDITRQQLEHVQAGLERIEGAAAAGEELLAATRVQRAQLRLARGRIEEALGSLQTALTTMAAKAEELAAAFLRLEATMLKAVQGCQLARLFREETDHLAAIADQSKQSNTRIAELVGRIDAVIQKFAFDVTEQQFDVMLVALNAQIAAARLAGAGALSRLAEETSSVSAKVGAMTEGITGQLRAALESLQTMKTEADQFQSVIDHDKASLEEQSGTVNTLLERLQTGLQKEAVATQTAYAEVHQRLGALAKGIALEEQAARCFEEAEQACVAIVSWHGQTATDLKQEDYAAAQAGYTMADEYAVHAEALGGAPAPTASRGKDIELF